MSQTTVPYNHRAVEQKWRKVWEDKPINVNDGKKPKYYCLDMFPYPSGNGLHVGHWRGYVISDVWSRYKLMHGYYVIHPMGWDAFGLPAENYAIKMGVHPEKSTAENIRNIKRQIQEIAAIYDWDMEVNTTDPEFYKWTQWIFVKMFKAGLAYEKEMPINWCPSCKTGLANEEVVNGKCERCGADVTKKNLKQWMLKITKYADRLLADLDKLDWPEKVKKMQTDWIGKSNGAEVNFKVDGSDKEITVYTTRPDTLHGATFMVLAPEHALAKEIATEKKENVISTKTANDVLSMMETVVAQGTGKNAKVEGYRIGGKTGTSEDGVNTNKYVTSFVGTAPISDPQVVVLIVLYNPTGQGGHQGGGVAAPIASQIFGEVLPYLETKQDGEIQKEGDNK